MGRRAGVVGVLRAGTFTGSGTTTVDCEGSDCALESVKVDHDEVSTPMLAGDVLFNLAGVARVGGGVGIVPFLKLKDVDGESELGTLVSVGVPAELVLDLTPKLAFTLRVQLDALILFPGDDLNRAKQQIADACGARCNVDGGPYLGVSGGVGPGLVLDMGSVGLRFDLMVQAYSVKTLHTEFETVDAKTDLTFSGVKTVAMAGVEF